jgi:UDP-3-O-[3-hydroxymyristoyl] glucosamine N-acyltransferase
MVYGLMHHTRLAFGEGFGYHGQSENMDTQRLTLREVAEIVVGSVEGDASFVAESIAPLDEAGPEDLTFADARHLAGLAESKAGAALVEADGAVDFADRPIVRVANVQQAIYQLLCRLAGQEDLPAPGICPTASVAPDAKLGRDAAIGPGAVLGAGAAIGDRTVLCANAAVTAGCVVGDDCVLAEGAVIRGRSVIGNRVRIGPNSVIGYDGFGFQTVDGVHRRFPHIGNVVIEDDVEIDACSCIDRGKFGSTRIGRGAKIDNLVQVAHNCLVGPGSILAGQVGIAGSVKLGRYCVLAGQVGVRDNITIGDGAQLGAQAGVIQNLPAGDQYTGYPARPAREMLRIWHSLSKLPDLVKHVRELESRLAALESSKAKNH